MFACLFFIAIFFMAGCRDDVREQELNKREQILLEKENQFALREADYQSLLKMRDSLLAKKDTIAPPGWPTQIEGLWNSKVVCTESNCSDYIVGDQRSDLWDFSSDSSQMVTKVISNNKLVRIYLAEYSNNQINLDFSTDSTAPKKVTMHVLLNETAPDKLKGTRTIAIDSACTAKFSVELNRVSNKE
ncbi:hypothetical protein SAMN05444277_11716 [Parafilimonas terrae]|uniref:Uncharacterized protein n=2 Tax=Parafilimonas terrae TaxID=1465490 RepID=A0A1I5Z6V6_9BACT|nr:hypothetical protein SAMN05444277_11716 [Parafilimonas terrae]